MFNDRISIEEARERITQREKEVESYISQARLGYGNRGTTNWFFLLFLLAAIVVVIGLLF